ncbi:MAG TPA: hypothetical protein PLD25_31390 [Chloroflexota bacterium]|nr:hypothetical protein [Chloroflexota bacterium]
MMATLLMTTSAGIILLLGIVHLIYTFRGPKLTPRDAHLKTTMMQVSPVISRDTTMWRAWLGFNASHSFGAILFGLVYGYLALSRGAPLFASPFLLSVGFIFLSGYALIGRLYWFRIPFTGIGIAFLCYLGSVIASFI